MSSPKTEHGVPERYPGNTSPATNDRRLCEQRTVIQRSRGTMQRGTVLTGPHDLVRRCQLQHLPHHCFLSTARHRRKHFADIEIHVLVHRGKVSRLTHIRIASVQQHERCLWVCRNQRLQMGRARTCKRDIRVAKARVELHCKGGGDGASSETGNRAARIGNDKEKK